MESPAVQPQRFVALDTHKHYIVPAAVDEHKAVVLQPCRVDLHRFDAWIATHLKPTDAVVIEAGPNTWDIYDRVRPHVAKVIVAHPYRVRAISTARVKTNARDALILARLLASDLIPEVWVPPQEVRDLRTLVAQRTRLVHQRTQARNRLHAILHRRNRAVPDGDAFAPAARPFWDTLSLGAVETLCVRQDLALLDTLQPLIAQTEAALLQQSTCSPWADHVAYLLQVSGVAVISAMTLLSAIGPIERFPTPAQLVSYAGLGASVYDSGETHRTGRITKQGRRELRTAMVEIAWVAVTHDPYWQAVFARLSLRMVPAKAIVAIARKMLVMIWHLLTHHQADHHADVQKVANKLMTWAEALCREGRHGLSIAAFTRQELTRLHLGQQMDTMSRWGRAVRLPPVSALISPPSG